MSVVVPFRHAGNPERGIDFDLYVDLLIIHHGFTRRDAEIEVRKECRRDNLTIIRSDPAKGYRAIGPEKSSLPVTSPEQKP